MHSEGERVSGIAERSGGKQIMALRPTYFHAAKKVEWYIFISHGDASGGWDESAEGTTGRAGNGAENGV